MIHEFFINGYWVRYPEGAIGGNWTTWDRFEVIGPNQVETAGLMPDIHSRWVFRDIVTLTWRGSDSVSLDPRGFEGFGSGGNTISLNRQLAEESVPIGVSDSIIGEWEIKKKFSGISLPAHLDRFFGTYAYRHWVFGSDGSLVLSGNNDTISASYTVSEPHTLTINYDNTASEIMVFVSSTGALILIEPNSGRLPGVIFTRIDDAVDED